MRHGSLFNGIGGFQLAAEWMGWENVFSSEIDEFCNKITKYYFPNCTQHYDIKKTDFTEYRGSIDIISGGFPCQPYSEAGKRKGTEDDRHLWGEMLRAICEIKPLWVVGENVRGLISWNGGMVFDEVQTDLEAEGYEVQPVLLPACGVDAPHKRDRVWFIAYSNILRSKRGSKSRNSDKVRKINKKQSTRLREFPQWEKFPTQPYVCTGDDGLSSRLDGITFSKWRTESIKAGGNAIVPQVALQIFKAIEEYERSISQDE